MHQRIAFIFFWAFCLAACTNSGVDGESPLSILEKCRTEEGLAEWTGSCPLGTAEGYGTAKYADSSQEITGNFKSGVPHGKVSIRLSSGATYVGGIEDGEWQGFGVFEEPWGKGYEGKWLAGFRHGKGVFTRADGKKMEGLWEKGRFLGSWYETDRSVCEVWWAIGSEPTGSVSWEGDCEGGKANGQGTLEWREEKDETPEPHFVIFEGRLAGGKLEGKGVWKETQVFTNVTHTIFRKGVWHNGFMSGVGEQQKIGKATDDVTPNTSDNYEGSFSEGRYEGQGKRVELTPNSTVQTEGLFAHGSLNGYGTIMRTHHRNDESKSYEMSVGIHRDGEFVGPGSVIIQNISKAGILREIVRYPDTLDKGGKGVTVFADGDIFLGAYDRHGVPFGRFGAGFCKLGSVSYSGKCMQKTKETGDYSGEACLVSPTNSDHCLKTVSWWVN